MISLSGAQSRLIALASPLEIEIVSLPEAVGRWTSAPVYAKRTQPARDLSAMDGYAIAQVGLPGPWSVIGESAAGTSFEGTIGPGQAVRIFTGAALPDAADTVIVQEDIHRTGDVIAIPAELRILPRQHVRLAGSDFGTGDLLIESSELLTPARLALAATGGHGAIPVRRKPVVEIVPTGDELVPAGAAVGRDQLPESNAIMLATMLRHYRCGVISNGIVGDQLDALIARFRASEADVLVTCGGASVGDHDLVRPALEACGAKLDFWKVAMRPGKPVMAGRLGNKIVLGLPGNPVSAFVTAHLFLLPLVAALSGAADPLPASETAICDALLTANGNRTDHLRARFHAGHVLPFGANDSAALFALANADCLIVREPNAPALAAGSAVEILRLN